LIKGMTLVLGIIVAVVVIGVAAYVFTMPSTPGQTTTTTTTGTTTTTTTQTTTTASQEPIKIGCIFNLTGSNSVYGYTSSAIVNVLEEKINAEGGIAGRPIEFYIEDDESNASVGAEKFRKLVEFNDVDFILGSVWSATDVACGPIAKETNTIYWPYGSATTITAEGGNRYVFRMSTNVREECKAASTFAIEEIGTKWTTIVADFSFGWSYEADFKTYIEEKGGEVLSQIRIPVGTADVLPYLVGKIAQDTDAVQLTVNLGLIMPTLTALNIVAPDIPKLGSCYVLSGVDTTQLGDLGNNLYVITSYPQRLPGLETDTNTEFRELIGVDEDGIDANGKWMGLPYGWAVWESMWAMKAAIEESGWQSKADNPALIQTLEGMEFQASLEHPQGDKLLRAEDHQCFTTVYIEKLEGGKTSVYATVPMEDAIYTPTVDRTTEEFVE